MSTNTNKLYLSFGTVGGKKSSIVLDNPKEGLTGETVRASMQVMLDANVFGNAEKSYASIDSSYTIESIKTDLV